MTSAEIEAYLHQQIPISAAMGVRVLVCDAGGATLAAPLKPNVNHCATVFGGSASAVAILTPWIWLHDALHNAGEQAQLLIQANTIDYLAPIEADFEAHCDAPDKVMFGTFVATFRRWSKARIELRASLTCGGREVAVFRGDYVALRDKG
jgi:thioesterase domain-containing protein